MIESFKIPTATFPTLTGSIVTFNSQYAGLPLKSHTVEVVATQSGSDTPSPDNVRTINGYSAINIMATGKNFAPINARTQTASGTTITVDNSGVVAVSGTGTASHFFEYYRGNFNFPKGTYRITAWVNGEEYTQSGSVNSPYRIYFSMTNGGTVNAGNTFTVNHDTGMWIIYIQTRNGFTYDDEVKVQIELGTFATEWQKFGKLVTINLGGTYYGGEYDARTGVFTVTHGYADLGSFPNWGYTSSGNRFTSGGVANEIKRPATDSTVADIIADIFDTKSLTALRSSADDNLIAVGDSGVISVRCTTYGTDANAFKTAMSGYYIVYELATPTTIQLPPCPIDTLEVNNIWADTGDTTLQYPKFG